MKKVFLLYLTTLLTLCACNKPGLESTPSASSDIESGVVKGRVVDEAGRPISNAVITASSTDYYNKVSIGYTDAMGYYRFNVPTGVAAGSYSVSGVLTVKYQSKQVKMALYQLDTKVFSAYTGAIRDFVFRLTGPRSPDDDAYATPLGATLEVHAHPDRVVTHQVDIILEPVGPLVDGSVGKKITLSLDEASSDLKDIPLGYYKFSARDRLTGKQLGVKVKDTANKYASSLTALFEDDNFEGSTEFRLILLIDSL
ncbi:hypothetical protein GCM10028805_63980 [Spirosoma harenae]